MYQQQRQHAALHVCVRVCACGDSTDDVDDETQLVNVIVAGEQRLCAQQLRTDAAKRPHVNSLRVLLRSRHNTAYTAG